MAAEDDVSVPLSRSRERVRVRARTLRESATDAETRLWCHLRDRRLAGYRFRRRRSVGPYFADFVPCKAQALQTLTPALSRKREREQDTKDLSP
ncbi:hypothetical protein H4CHR_00842 [Variovorax sp. PBS-H4]|uniref:endonuclease domain-containing protein n=1 Tax=Variovorax sp. PBS-H4 TaxID=434008 RepID=UPI0013188DCD|nr:hypothetical protein H4CHR_00842 [Variovorax sp. PBS-H4]